MTPAISTYIMGKKYSAFFHYVEILVHYFVECMSYIPFIAFLLVVYKLMYKVPAIHEGVGGGLRFEKEAVKHVGWWLGFLPLLDIRQQPH